MIEKILLAGRDAKHNQALSDMLMVSGYEVESHIGTKAIFCLDLNNFDLIIAEAQTVDHNAVEFLQQVKKQSVHIPVIFIASAEDKSLAVKAISEGAFDYLSRPFEPGELLELITSAASQYNGHFLETIPIDQSVREIYRLAMRVAKSDLTVMITGESGTGKEILSSYIHKNSNRNHKTMVSINCAAIPETMLESILFGYEKGAFTGANQSYAGKFEQANGGTLLLDEITEMDIGLQAKLLRVIQERQVERLGSKKTIDLDIRIIATSNRNLREEVQSGRFREDLLYRLNVFPLTLPPLRQRKMDIVPLAHELLRKHKLRCDFSFADEAILSTGAKELLINYDWQGNIRELENVMQRALILASSAVIESKDIIFESRPESSNPQLTLIKNNSQEENKNILNNELQLTEQEIIIATLVENNGSRKNTAEKLGISPRTLRYKLSRMRDLGIDIPNKGAA